MLSIESLEVPGRSSKLTFCSQNLEINQQIFYL